MEVASGDSSHGTTTVNAGATRWMAPELFHADPLDFPPNASSPLPGATSREPDGKSEMRVAEDARRVSEEGDRFDGVTPRSDVWGMHFILRVSMFSDRGISIWDDHLRANDWKGTFPPDQE